MARSDRVKKGVTSVVEDRNTTTGKQTPLRLTQNDSDALSLLIDRVQEQLPNKKISRSRVLRAVGYLNEDQAFVKKLSRYLIENT